MTVMLFDLDSQVAGLIALVAFAAIVTVVSFAIATLKRRVGTRVSENWDQVQGTVEHASVQLEDRGKLSVNVATFSYSYRVAGDYYAGKFTKDFMREQKADEFTASLPAGTPIFVRVNPAKPERSMFREQDNASAFLARGTQG